LAADVASDKNFYVAGTDLGRELLRKLGRNLRRKMCDEMFAEQAD